MKYKRGQFYSNWVTLFHPEDPLTAKENSVESVLPIFYVEYDRPIVKHK